MFKNLLLLTSVAVLGLWAAGYDLASFKRDVLGVADGSAGQMSGRSTLEDGGWGD